MHCPAAGRAPTVMDHCCPLVSQANMSLETRMTVISDGLPITRQSWEDARDGTYIGFGRSSSWGSKVSTKEHCHCVPLLSSSQFEFSMLLNKWVKKGFVALARVIHPNYSGEIQLLVLSHNKDNSISLESPSGLRITNLIFALFYYKSPGGFSAPAHTFLANSSLIKSLNLFCF